jgi:glycerol-1-phosphate dehydrogenase [NAD(P)+]
MIKFQQKQIFIPSILKIGKGEMANLGNYLKDENFTNIACFFSEGIEEFFGEKIYNSLNANKINVLHKDIIDEINIENIIHTAFKIPKNVDALVGIGGGKALDYSKYCAFVLDLPFISIPTSTSNDGFCSPNSSLLADNKRRSVKAKIPYGVIVDIETLQTSPLSCIYSGIGDLISKLTAGWDWQKASQKSYEQFNDFANLIANNTVTDIINYQNLDIRSTEFLYHLANALLMNGLSMEIAGSSRPASGSEHLISHAYDEIAAKPSMHGIQVGVAAYTCAYIQKNQFETVKHFLQSTGFFEYVSKYPLNRAEFIESIRHAPKIKDNFYTVLSEPENIEIAINFVETDDLMQKLLV